MLFQQHLVDATFNVPPFPPSSELHAVAQVQLSIFLMDDTSLFPLGLVMTSK